MGMNFFDQAGNHVGKRCCAGKGQMTFVFNKNVVMFPGSTVMDEAGNEFNVDDVVGSCVTVSEQCGTFC